MKLSTLKFEVMAMFTQRKSFFKGKLFYIIILVLFAFGLWLNQPVEERSPTDVNTGTDYSDASDRSAKKNGQADKGNYDILDGIVDMNDPISTSSGAAGTDTSNNGISTAVHEGKSYYLIKEVDGVIKIFHYNEDGKESLIKETDIAFSLLSVTDQTLFKKGVIRHSPEELDELLQDFES